MAIIVTVHGTFAHSEGDAATGGAPSPLQWWQPGSDFEHDMHALLETEGSESQGPLQVTRFEWSGDNSEMARREAGRKLYRNLKALEAQGETYCLVGHSHGGSVVNWALLEAAAKRQQLKGLKRWITVGTPFVSLKKERFLFQRLDLVHKAIFVASFMLLAMFLIDVVTQVYAQSAHQDFLAWLQRRGLRWLTTAVMMSLPIIFFYFALRYWNARSLLHYRRRVRRRAKDYFESRWLPLTHTDDEAVQGLAFLPGARLYFFDNGFAVPAITMLSIVAVPLLYLGILNSPKLMVGIGDVLRNQFYVSGHPETEKILIEAREARREWRRLFPTMTRNQASIGVRKALTPAERDAISQRYIAARKALTDDLPGKRAAERALQFRRQFFEERGKPCNPEGKLCGMGESLQTNSRLLLYIVTNHVASAIVGDDSVLANRRSLYSIVIPALLVPLIFGVLALLFTMLIRAIAILLSRWLSAALNLVTNSEVKRAAFGNDTEGEIAIGAIDRPSWVERSPPRLPPAVADLVTDYSNTIAGRSLSKFRKAIGELASAEPKHTADTAITTYFTWKELVHASYFDVPEFRKLIAQAVAKAEGYQPSETFRRDPDFRRTAQWLAQIERMPGPFTMREDGEPAAPGREPAAVAPEERLS